MIVRLVVLVMVVGLLALGEADYRKSPGYAVFARANALFSAGKMEESRVLADRSLELDPNLLPALTLRARLAMALRDHAGARNVLLRAVKVAPASWQAHFLLGFQCYLESDLHAAMASLEKAMSLEPDEASPALYLGLTHESLGNTERAVEYYRRAIRIEDGSGKLQAETLLTPARLLLLLNRLDEASALISRAVRIQPDLRDAHYESARLSMKRGDAPSAAAAGERALALTVGAVSDQQIRYVLVRAYRLLGDDQRAASHAEILRNTVR